MNLIDRIEHGTTTETDAELVEHLIAAASLLVTGNGTTDMVCEALTDIKLAETVE